MTNDKPNSNSDWINKLDELESIQGAAFNKEASWNKLHERLYSKSNKRKAIWYWLAAACLFFALFISLFVSLKKGNILVHSDIKTSKSNSTFLQHKPIIKKDTHSLASSLSNKNKLPLHSTYEVGKRNTPVKKDIAVEEIIQNKKEAEVSKELGKPAVTPVDTLMNLVINNAPLKRKLMVVHVNELGDPVAESPNVARNNEQHSFQFKFMNQEVYTRSSLTVTKPGFKIFTTKNLTTN